MQLRLRSFLVFFGLVSSLVLFAQTTPPPTPVAKHDQLRKEQEVLNDIYLKRGEGAVARALQRLGTSAVGLARENALEAAEMVGRSKLLADYNGPRIPFAKWGPFNATAVEKKTLKDNLDRIHQRRYALEEQLVGLGIKIGDPELIRAIDAARKGILSVITEVGGQLTAGDPNDPTRIGDPREDDPNPTPPAEKRERQEGKYVVLRPTQTNQNECRIEGRLSSNGRTVVTSNYGDVDLDSYRPEKNGDRVYGTSLGVLVVKTDCTGEFYPNMVPRDYPPKAPARIPTPITSRDPLPTPTPPFNPDEVNGDVKLVDYDSDPTAPPFVGGKRSWIRSSYPNGKGNLLVRERKMRQEIVEKVGDKYRANEYTDGSRDWKLNIKLVSSKPVDGGHEAIFELETGGNAGGISITGFTIESEGDPVSVQPVLESALARKVVLKKSGTYIATVRGQTDWGSAFTLEADFPFGGKQ